MTYKISDNAIKDLDRIYGKYISLNNTMNRKLEDDVGNLLNGKCTLVSNAVGIKVISLPCDSDGEFAETDDIAIVVPETENYKIQELLLPIYHRLCLMLEEYFLLLGLKVGYIVFEE